MTFKGAIILSLALSVLFSNNIEAERIDGNTNKIQSIISSLSWSDSNPIKLENGLNLLFGSVQVIGLPFKGEAPSDSLWCKREPFGMKYSLDVSEILITFENTSDKLMIVDWSKSTYNLGTYSGAVMFPGIKYSDAGNASALPNMPIPPKSFVTKQK